VETVAQADLLWDDEARGLCLRVYGDGREISPVEDLIQYIAENLVKKA
jgi:hypothetical protein